MTAEIIEKMAADIAEIKNILADIIKRSADVTQCAEIDAELTVLEANGLDIVEFYKNKAKARRQHEPTKCRSKAKRSH